MRNRFLLGTGIALAAALSWAPAQAQLFAAPSAPGAWYFGGEGGWTSLDSVSGNKIGPFSHKQSFNTGENVGARAGYEWGPWRFEEEFSYRQNGLNHFSIGGLNLKTTGERDAYALMTNAIYDFNIGWALTPHLGVGVGAVEMHDGVGLPKFGTIVHSDNVQFGYQAIAGIRYNINPSLAFDFDYRYLATTTPTFHTAAFRVPYTSGFATNNLVASLTVRFGAPPPPAVVPPMPPAPPPMARKVFLVFFDWDKDTITPEGMQIIQQAAATFRSGAPVTIQVTGYTDRSGSPGYNQRLSERRANNVANALSRVGVPRTQMAVSGRGENDNRVPTAPGVREPQNRRVEIVFP
jgi:OmpA-OmpF porin, OOP family